MAPNVFGLNTRVTTNGDEDLSVGHVKFMGSITDACEMLALILDVRFWTLGESTLETSM